MNGSQNVLKEQIVDTVKLAHEYGNAYSRKQVMQFLPIKADRPLFQKQLSELIQQDRIYERNNLLFAQDFWHSHHRKRWHSRQLFDRYRKYLKLLSGVPWVRFMGLTGANAFESCNEKDDIDLFVVTAKNRLWIVYVLMVVIGKITGLRQLCCLNYLIDEANMEVQPQSYYVAVQMVQMQPLFNARYKKRLIESNTWISHQLPNATPDVEIPSYYRLKKDSKPASVTNMKWLSTVNEQLYRIYAARLRSRYPQSINRGIVLATGVAKLHRVDHNSVYDHRIQTVKKQAV